VGPHTHAFIWTEGTLEDLGLLPGFDNCWAGAINDHSDVVGTCRSGYQFQAFLWTAKTGMTALDIPHLAFAYGINNHDDIVGVWNPSDDQVTWNAFAYRDGHVEDLDEGVACGINDRGQIAGARRPDPYSSHAVVWDEGGKHDLDDEGGPSGACGISAAGLIAGRSMRGSQFAADQHAVLWTPYGLSDLGTLEGSKYGSSATAISGDLIVGYSSSPVGHAFLYDINGPGYAVDLNDLIPADSGWVLDSAWGVNAAGQIVGGLDRAFLLTPVQPTPPR
jgi:uncharacterized membrane protein